MNKEKAIKLDAILLKFHGDISIQHYDDNINNFKEIDTYYKIENYLKFLESENMVENIPAKVRTYKLRPRGWATMTEIKTEGYVSKHKEKQRNEIIKWTTLFTVIVTLMVTIFSLLIPIYHKSEPMKSEQIKRNKTYEGEQLKSKLFSPSDTSQETIEKQPSDTLKQKMK
jgi:ABC-type sugar transport system permease subunit